MIRPIFLSIALAIAVTAPAISLAADKAESANPGKPTLDVVMYSTASCPYCEKARQWFISHKVAWDERDVETSEAARRQWQEMGAVGTPVIVINGKRFTGFMQEALEAEIAKYR